MEFHICRRLLAKGNQVKHDYVYFEFHEGDGAQAVRKGKWKAVVNGVKKANPSALELYDLESDPGEKNNVANLFPEVLAEMSAIIGKAHVPSKVFAISADAN